MVTASVIIPTYNRASLLNRTLDSLTRQSSKDFQIILVDHSSTDNTEEIFQKYSETFHMTYHRLERKETDTPGVPRDFGARLADTPLIIFLDSGTIVPSTYIQAHLTFHQQHRPGVGIGLRHGYKEEAGEDVMALLNSMDIDQAATLLKGTPLEDERTYLDLEKSSIPWFFGWTANLSVPREDYLAVGGFNPELLDWGFEDGDLCYRLFRKGLKVLFVEDGWSVELPQKRKAVLDRMRSNQKNVLHCYLQQRTVGLETLVLVEKLLRHTIGLFRALPAVIENPARQLEVRDMMRAQFSQHPELLFRFLAQVGREKKAHPTLPEQVRTGFARPALLIGGTMQNAGEYDYITLFDESATTTTSLWSCCGIVLPLADASLETVVVSEVWRLLDWHIDYPFGMASMSLLEVLISEIRRTARRAVFVYTPAETADGSDPAKEVLAQLCQHYQIPFELLSTASIASADAGLHSEVFS